MAPSIKFGVLTVSDRCFNGTAVDSSGPKLEEQIKTKFPGAAIKARAVVPDSENCIKEHLMRWSSSEKCDVILTTGGTGFATRDVTPEATRAVIDREAPALIFAMTQGSLAVTPMAMLSRAVCGLRDRTLIVNLPGSAKAAVECFGFIAGALNHAVDLLNCEINSVEKTHSKIQNLSSKVKVNCAASRERNSPYPMVMVWIAQEMITSEIKNDSIETVDLYNCLYRVLSQDYMSTNPLPPFPASIKDGYAVIAADGLGFRKVIDEIAAGDVPGSWCMKPGECVRISTGAPVPPGADAVVQVEDTEFVQASKDLGKELLIKINIAPALGQDIRPIGSDIPNNYIVLRKGMVLSSAHIGVLAAIGVSKVEVYAHLSIGIISTGNELQSANEVLRPGGIRDSNKPTLINLLKQYNYKSTDCGTCKDDPNDVKRALTAAFQNHDVIITTGGVSMGDHDVVKQVLIADFHAQIHFGRVNMKPGKPTTFATCVFNLQRKYIFALPGNPVSATVTTILFVLPALRHYEHYPQNVHQTKVILDEEVALDPRPEYARAEAYIGEDGKMHAKLSGNQISSKLNSFVGAQVLIMLPAKEEYRKCVAAGTVLDAIRIDPFNF